MSTSCTTGLRAAQMKIPSTLAASTIPVNTRLRPEDTRLRPEDTRPGAEPPR